RPIARKNNVEVVLESIRPVTAEVDEVKFTLAISNLVENAIKYNKENGKITVFVGEGVDGVELSIKDTGIGIPHEDKERIFERFYRVDKSHSKKVGGTGLGLSIVKHVCACHGAKIKVKSIVGKGTTMSVTFPIDEKEF
ncbi:MAG: ATP-binding protein, partial [Clostridia bacterium]|nr:ATP-binding protein [Clostridia bacterium]